MFLKLRYKQCKNIQMFLNIENYNITTYENVQNRFSGTHDFERRSLSLETKETNIRTIFIEADIKQNFFCCHCYSEMFPVLFFLFPKLNFGF